jgi:hypothetical protein
MSIYEVSLPDHVVSGEELEEVWDRLLSFSNAVMDEAGVVIKEVHDETAGDFRRISIPLDAA